MLRASRSIQRRPQGDLSACLYPVKLFPQYRAHFLANFLGEARTLHVLSKRIVDQGLIVPAMGFANQFAKVIDDVAVQPNGDPDLPLRQRNYSSSLAPAEIVFPLHIRLSSYCARSREVALRAEIMRMVLPCTVYEIARTRPCASMPKVK